MSTYLNELIDRQVAATVAASWSRAADRIAEQLADEMLRDPQIRTQMLILVRAAFDKAVTALNQDAKET